MTAAAELQPNGCRLTSLTPSKDRPLVWITGGKQVSAIRVIAAVSLGRPIEPDEDVHHTCQTPRCVEATHLQVLPYQAHSDHHAEDQEQSRCSVHNRPYDRREARGWGVCRECQREANRRYAARRPEALRNRTYSPETIAKKAASSKTRRNTPEYKAKAAAAQKARRAKLKEQQATEQKDT